MAPFVQSKLLMFVFPTFNPSTWSDEHCTS